MKIEDLNDEQLAFVEDILRMKKESRFVKPTAKKGDKVKGYNSATGITDKAKPVLGVREDHTTKWYVIPMDLKDSSMIDNLTKIIGEDSLYRLGGYIISDWMRKNYDMIESLSTKIILEKNDEESLEKALRDLMNSQKRIQAQLDILRKK